MAMVDVVSQPHTRGPMTQVCYLGPNVGSNLALFCIHRVTRENSESWRQHHKQCPGYYHHYYYCTTLFATNADRYKMYIILAD